MIKARIKEDKTNAIKVIDNDVWTLYKEQSEDVVVYHCNVHKWSKSSFLKILNQFKSEMNNESRLCMAWCPNFKVFKFALMLGMQLSEEVYNLEDGTLGYLVKERVCHL